MNPHQSIKTLEICVAVPAVNHVDLSSIHYHYTNGNLQEKEANMIFVLSCIMVSFFFNFEKIPLSVVGVFDFKRLLISTYRSFGGFFDSSGSLRAALSVGAREPLNFKVNTLYILEFNSRNSFSNPRRY